MVADAILYAIGRMPNTDGIGLEEAGIALDERGFVRVDDHLATNVRGVHALGDVNGRDPFTHAATAQADYLAEKLLDGRRSAIDHGPMPDAIFTQPEIGAVGATERSLRAARIRHEKSVVRYAEVANGVAIKERHGFAKLLTRPDGRILGFHVVGAHASILLHEVVQAMRWRDHVSSLTDALTVHPSLSELVAEAAWRIVERLPASKRRGPGR